MSTTIIQAEPYRIPPPPFEVTQYVEDRVEIGSGNSIFEPIVHENLDLPGTQKQILPEATPTLLAADDQDKLNQTWAAISNTYTIGHQYSYLPAIQNSNTVAYQTAQNAAGCADDDAAEWPDADAPRCWPRSGKRR